MKKFLSILPSAVLALSPAAYSGGFGRSLDKLPDSVPGAAILEGLHINGDRVDGAAGDVAAWIDSLGL